MGLLCAVVIRCFFYYSEFILYICFCYFVLYHFCVAFCFWFFGFISSSRNGNTFGLARLTLMLKLLVLMVLLVVALMSLPSYAMHACIEKCSITANGILHQCYPLANASSFFSLTLFISLFVCNNKSFGPWWTSIQNAKANLLYVAISMYIWY